MRARTKSLLATAVGLLLLWIGWGVYGTWTTKRVPYETVERFDDFEIRRYPATVLVETTADDQRTAFRRLFGYITGENEAPADVGAVSPGEDRGEKFPMTAPVRTLLGAAEAVAMTAPVRTERGAETVTMAFYLPPEYGPDRAPVPTDPRVHLVVEPPRTVAVRRFSWYATAGRVERQRRRLVDALAERDIEPRDEPVTLQYNDPLVPPFLRRNEVAVTVEDEAYVHSGP